MEEIETGTVELDGRIMVRAGDSPSTLGRGRIYGANKNARSPAACACALGREAGRKHGTATGPRRRDEPARHHRAAPGSTGPTQGGRRQLCTQNRGNWK